MTRSYKELNQLEREGLKTLLRDNDWHNCQLTKAGEPPRAAMSKMVGNRIISIELDDFRIDDE